jgi:O-succinylbenzoic acid--CoA ligase
MRPDRVAIETGSGGVTYAELEARSRAAAGVLVERGVGVGDRVALALPAGVEFVAALHGCMLAGAVAVPIDLRLGEEERTARARNAVVVVDEGLSGAPLTDTAPMDTDAIATVMHTSGTMAAPRQVPLSHGNWLHSALGSVVGLGLDRHERWLCPMPLAHVGGLSIPIRSAIYATTAVLSERFDVEEILEWLMDTAHGITLVSLVPTMLSRLLDAGLRKPPALRWALLGGGPIPAPLLERAAGAGVPVAPTYGMTEACSQIASFGWPLPGVSVQIGPGGEILVSGPNVSASALDADGWLHTGDLGGVDGRGRLRVTGRKAETIITGGENVAPAEVEAVLLAHPAVADAGVHGHADPEWGEVVVATVVLRDGAAVGADELRSFCADRLARFKVPKEIGFASKLPRTESGKLLRREL